MSEEREVQYSMGNNEKEEELPRAEVNNEDDDVYAQLAQKERDLILAAELGKALLDSNQELQSRYDQAVEEYTHKLEELQQEKHDIHLELEKMGIEYQNAIKDLQEDVTALRKHARANDELQVSERERSRSLREAQQNSDYLFEMVKKASLREEELIKDFDQLKMRNESNCATITDQLDHISMLREQVEHLSEKLQETNQKLHDIQEEKTVLINTFEMTHENTQTLEIKLLEQEVKIQRQTSVIEELQESNADLLQQIQQRQSLQQHQLRAPYLSSRSNTSTRHNSSGSRQKTNSLLFETNHEKQRQSSYPQSFTNQQQKQEQVKQANKQLFECVEDQGGDLTKIYEQSLFSELTQGDNGELNPITSEFSSMCHHNRSTGDCSICCVAEGSRKRHHQNVGGGSDDDEISDSGPKQSLYSESHHSVYDPHGNSASSIMDSNGNQISYQIPTQYETRRPLKLDISGLSTSAKLTQTGKINVDTVLHDSLPLSESFQKSCLPHNSNSKESPTSVDIPSQFEDTSYSGEVNNEKSLFSELSHYAQEFCSRQQDIPEQSLFSELSSQLYDDRNGTGSESSSNGMLGIFDFSGSDAQDVDRNSNESLNRSMEIRSRIESDMSYVSDWYYMTPVTSEMLEEDDFECDDDDFLVGNMAGTTLSISDGNHGLRYHYHGYVPEEDITDQDCGVFDDGEISCSKESASKGHNKQQAQLSEACRQLQELVIRVQGESCSSVRKASEDFMDANTDILLSLVAETKACFDKIIAQKEGQLQSSDISTTMNDVAGSADDVTGQTSQQHKHDLDVGNSNSPTKNLAGARYETLKQMRKSKSSSSLV